MFENVLDKPFGLVERGVTAGVLSKLFRAGVDAPETGVEAVESWATLEG